jgi:hypothetical protein
MNRQKIVLGLEAAQRSQHSVDDEAHFGVLLGVDGDYCKSMAEKARRRDVSGQTKQQRHDEGLLRPLNGVVRLAAA